MITSVQTDWQALLPFQVLELWTGQIFWTLFAKNVGQRIRRMMSNPRQTPNCSNLGMKCGAARHERHISSIVIVVDPKLLGCLLFAAQCHTYLVWWCSHLPWSEVIYHFPLVTGIFCRQNCLVLRASFHCTLSYPAFYVFMIPFQNCDFSFPCSQIGFTVSQLV